MVFQFRSFLDPCSIMFAVPLCSIQRQADFPDVSAGGGHEQRELSCRLLTAVVELCGEARNSYISRTAG